MYVYAPVFPVYAGVLGASLSTIGLAVGAYGLTQVLLRIPLGIWSDAVGRRRIFVVAGLLVCAVAALGFVYSTTPAMLVVFRGVMGVSAATWVCSTVLFTSYFPGRHSSVPLSIMTFAQSIGQILAVTGGGLLAQRFGWIAPFWAAFALSIAGAAVMALVPEDTSARAMAVSKESMLRTASDRSLLLACAIGALMQFASWSTVNTFTPILAADVFHATKAQLGYLTTLGLIGYSVVTLLTSRLVSAIGEKWALVVGLSVMMLGILPTPLVGTLTGLTVLQVINGSGRALLYTLLLSLAIRTASSKDRASAMGIFQAVYALGMFLGPSLSGRIADGFGLNAVFILCGLVLLVCIPVAFIFAPGAISQPRRT
jgi:MFS family permease